MGDERRAIILIHGIGDQVQRATLNAFIDKAALVRDDSGGKAQIVRTPADTPGSQPYSYVTQDTALADRHVVVAEMFWSDVAVVESGYFAPLRNFFSLASRAPDIAYASLGPELTPSGPRDHIVLRILRVILALGFWTIYFPIVAFNLAYAILFLGFAVDARFLRADQMLRPDNGLGLPADSIFGAISAISVLLCLFVAARTANEYGRAILKWIAAFLVVVFLVAIPGILDIWPEQTYGDYRAVLDSALTKMWLLPMMTSILFFVTLPYLFVRFRSRWRGLLLGYAVNYLGARFWLLLITTCWLLFLKNAMSEVQSNALRDVLATSISFLSLMWLDIGVIALVFASNYLFYQLRSRSAVREPQPGETFPRLFVPPLVLFVPIVMSCIWIWALWTCLCSQGDCNVESCAPIVEGTKWILTNAWWLIIIGGFAMQLANLSFKIATDAVNYFEGGRLHRAPNPVQTISTAFNFQLIDPRTFRTILRDRMMRLIDDLCITRGPFDKLTIVAHSLGSMVAIDALRAMAVAESSRMPVLSLVTMGSPYANIFRYYFPHLFPRLAKEQIAGAGTFANIYRVNDYVGTTLLKDVDSIQEFPQPAKLPPDAHYDYFSDRAVVEKIIRDT